MSEREEKQKKERKTKRDTNPMRQGSSAETHGKEFFDKIARRGDA
jgi:hypothetical protein